jgi:hypothetical protein
MQMLVVVSTLTPSLAFSARRAWGGGTVSIQTFRSELAVQAFDERVISRFFAPAEVGCDSAHESPQICLYL